MRKTYQKIALLALFVVVAGSVKAQVRVGSSGPIDGSASLEVWSGTFTSGSPYRGLLPPKVTTTNRDQIQSPATGLLIFNTTTNQVEVNTGTPAAPIWTAGGAIGGGAAGAWSLTGNAATSSNFLGTTNNVPLNFRVNNISSGQIDPVNFNTSLGYLALRSLTTGYRNTAIGVAALELTASGYTNTALGYGTLQHNTTGYENAAIGTNAANANTTGYSNVAIGTDALIANLDGHDNVALGGSALLSNTSGLANMALGTLAMRYNTTGQANTASGYLALQYNTTGNSNTALGYNAGPSSANTNLTNSTAIGANAVVTASNTIVLGDGNITALRSNVQTISALSDKRIKEDINANVPGLSFITKLTPVTYHINKTKEAKLVGYAVTNVREDKTLHSGFLAQDVEAAAKAVGYNFEGVRQEEGGKYYTVGYTLFVMPLVQAVKDLNAEVETLKAQLQESSTAYTQLAAQVKQMQEVLGVSKAGTNVKVGKK